MDEERHKCPVEARPARLGTGVAGRGHHSSERAPIVECQPRRIAWPAAEVEDIRLFEY